MRAAIKLLLWLAIVWVAAAQWVDAQDLAADWFTFAVTALKPESSFGFTLVVLLASLGATAPLALALFVPVRANWREARFEHGYPDKPLRILLRLSRWRLLSSILWLALCLLVALRISPSLLAGVSPPTPFAWQAADWHDAWIGASSVTVVAIVIGWGVLAFMARLSADWRGFCRYHVKVQPVFEIYWRALVFGLLPVMAHSATQLSGLWHSTISVAFVTAFTLTALLAQSAVLVLERMRDRRLTTVEQAPGAIYQAPYVQAMAFLGQYSTRPPVARVETPSVAPVAQPAAPAAAHDAVTDSTLSANYEGPRTDVSAADLARMDADSASVGTGDEVSTDRATANGDDHVFVAPDSDIQPEPLDSSRIWWILRAGVVVSAAASVVITFAAIWQLWLLPSGEETLALARSAHIHVRKTDNSPASLLGSRFDYSLNTKLENVSPHFVNAVVASEDHRFFEHGSFYKLAKFAEAGVLCAARKVNIFSSAKACAGNSTIPQQLARNLLLSEKRSIVRKLKELLWAIKMEWSLSKDTILELYLNRLYLGRGNFGVELGSRYYFEKSSADLTLYESALLAAAVKRPGWNWRDNREAAFDRARIILALMRRHGYAPEDARLADSFKPRVGQRPPSKPYLGHLWQWLRPQIVSVLKDLPNGDYKIVTSLNAEVEIYAERHLSQVVRAYASRGKPVTQGAVVVMRPDGQVLAMAGGVGKTIKARGLNRAKRTKGLHSRPPASSFKPFVYLAALEKGLSPESDINASPVNIPMPAPQPPYRPRNHDGKTYGEVTLRDGLVKSINTAAVNLLYEHVGFERLFDVVRRLGIDASQFPEQWGVALGAASVSLVEMTGAYAAFANGGVSAQPHALMAVTTADGKIVWKRKTPSTKRRFRRDDIEDMNAMLSAVLAEGTGRRAIDKLPKTMDVAGKTGTGDSFTDAWFVGYTPDVIIGVWMGNDRPRSMPGLYGGTGPAQVFNRIARDLVAYTNVMDVSATFPRQ